MPIRPDLRVHYRTPEYQAARERVVHRAQGRCEHCMRPKDKVVPMISGKDVGGELFMFWRNSSGWVNRRGWPAKREELMVLAEVASWRRYESKTQLQLAHLDNNPANQADENLAYICGWCHLVHDIESHHQTRAKRKDDQKPLLRMIEGAA
jgi:hypothetical protein